jgi:hypothetical protein
MIESMIEKDSRLFWDEYKKMNRQSNNISEIIDDMDNYDDIANLFANKYCELYNCTPSSNLTGLRDSINDDIRANLECTDYIITAAEVEAAANLLHANKPDGHYNLWSNHIKYGSARLYDFISSVLTLMYLHGMSPQDLLDATIISIPKCSLASMNDSSNYRGIALISSLAKINELIIKTRYHKLLCTSNFQFSYKKNHSTITCFNVVKETINYYVKNHSNVYCCMLDASKAFDRLRYDLLFDILKKRGIPPIILRFLLDYYVNQSICAKYGTSLSNTFSASNGVKQGGILSPILYCIYIKMN